MDQKLPVPLGTENGAFGDAEHPAPEVPGEGSDFFDDLGMLVGVAHHPSLADLPPPDLELRLDQGKDLARFHQKLQRGGQDQVEGNEGGVDYRQIGASPSLSGERCRMLVRSRLTTRGSARSFQAS